MTVRPVEEVAAALERVIRTDVASVHRISQGVAVARCILDQGHLVLKSSSPTSRRALSIDASAKCAEVGNILLNACLGTFGNLLKVQVSFSVPQLSLESVGAILESLRISREGLQYALVVHAGFKLRDAEVHGYLVIVLSVASLDRMLRAVEEWENRDR